MLYQKVLLLVLICSAIPSFVNAQTDQTFESFQSYYEVELPTSVIVPTVVELPLPGPRYEYPYFAVYDVTRGNVVPYYYNTVTNQQTLPVAVEFEGEYRSSLSDGKFNTSYDFPLLDDNGSSAALTLTADVPIESSSLTFSLAPHVTLPTSVTVKALVNGVEQVILSKYRPTGSQVTFPMTRSAQWYVEFTYSQPLRITELSLGQPWRPTTFSHSLRWLAQPGVSYIVYENPDQFISVPVGESANLTRSEGVVQLSELSPYQNPEYMPSDVDDDGVPDLYDNCVNTINPDQVDIDENERGDACDDFDRDGVINSIDNCLAEPNRNQADEDGDEIGDVCDEEESRITEKYMWIPWVGMGLAGLVIFALFALVARTKPRIEEEKTDSTDVPTEN